MLKTKINAQQTEYMWYMIVLHQKEFFYFISGLGLPSPVVQYSTARRQLYVGDVTTFSRQVVFLKTKINAPNTKYVTVVHVSVQHSTAQQLHVDFVQLVVTNGVALQRHRR